MIKGLIRALWWLSRDLPNPELNPDLGPFFTHLRLQEGRDPRDLPPEIWEAYVAEAIVNAIVDAWDHYGAPSVAKAPEGGYIGSAEGPGGAFFVRAESKRKAYETVRKEWLRRILATKLGLGEAK
jgi:hypothetical protein